MLSHGRNWRVMGYKLIHPTPHFIAEDKRNNDVKTYASIVFTPTLNFFIRVWPKWNNEFKKGQILKILTKFLFYRIHCKSHSNPWSGTSVGLIILLICSIDSKSGDKPPWQQNIFSSIIAAKGRQLKQSVNVFHNLIL